jgi:hypothetical protein
MLFTPLTVSLASANTSHRTRSVSNINYGIGQRIVVKSSIQNGTKIRPLAGRSFPRGHEDMAKLTTAFRNLLNVPNYAVSDLEVRGSSWTNYGYWKRKVKMKHPFSLNLQPIVCGSAKVQTELVRICKW